jgi:hypothetical protein
LNCNLVKVKKAVPEHTIDIQESGVIAPLTQYWIKVSGQLPASPTYSQAKSPWYPLNKRLCNNLISII